MVISGICMAPLSLLLSFLICVMTIVTFTLQRFEITYKKHLAFSKYLKTRDKE